MIKQVTRIFVPLAAFLMYMAGTNLYGQQQSIDNQQLRQAAISSFDEGDYRAALKEFRILQETESADLQLGYYLGRCMVELNEDLDEAIELLYHASRQSGPSDAVFYLGRAYHLNYNFNDARSCYEQYERLAGRQERKAHQLEQLIATCASASEITGSYNPYEVMNVTFMDLTDSSQYSQVKMKGGDLGRKPEGYFHPDEDPKALTALMFMPKEPVRGDYLFYAGYNRNGKDGSQIFRVRKGTGKTWGDPQEVSSLNSPGNEILPYFDPIENDLYFASDGRNGIGGYDLYRSHYDMERDVWTDVVNLGFPVNSVVDEYLLLPGSDLGMVLFFSTRQGTDSTVAVYRVHLIEPKEKTALYNDVQLREIAQLGGVAQAMRASLEPGNYAEKGTPEVNLVQEMGSDVTQKGAQTDEPLPAFQVTLAQALAHQAVSDSLKDLAADARIKVRESEDPNDRWVWQKQIMVWEKNARDEQLVADQLYAQMEEERSIQMHRPAVNPPETIEVDREIGDLTVFRYTGPATGDVPDPGTGPASGTGVESKLKAETAIPIYRFEILDQAPYSERNPIPMDVAVPSGTFYRIQLGAYGMELKPEIFGGISPITGEYMKDRGLVKYYAGEFSRYDDASSALPRIQSLGYEDAFIVAWYNGIQVSTQKAKQLE